MAGSTPPPTRRRTGWPSRILGASAVVFLLVVLGVLVYVRLRPQILTPEDRSETTVSALLDGIAVTWQPAGSGSAELDAWICWRSVEDPTTGSCPFRLQRRGVSAPFLLALGDFDCDKCPDLPIADVALFLDDAIRVGSNSKLFRWELTIEVDEPGTKKVTSAGTMVPSLEFEDVPPPSENPLSPQSDPTG